MKLHMIYSCSEHVKKLFLKYKYTLLCALVGILLMLIPANKNKTVHVEAVSQNELTDNLKNDLEIVLSQIDGVGKVKVILTYASSEEKIYYENYASNKNEGHRDEEWNLVFVENSTGAEEPIVVKTLYPVYEGALIVCQGADKASVKLNLINAVSSLTGLSSDKITVVKMKG